MMYRSTRVKVFILAGGLGTRVRPLGYDLPKVMLPIGHKPLLQHHLELFRAQGFTEFIINLHHMPEKIRDVFGDGRDFGVEIAYSLEPVLLGTAGAVRRMQHALRGGTFLVFYGDNLVRMSFAPLVAFHRARRALFSMALFESDEPWTGGVVETDSTGMVVSFVEKPDRARPHRASISAGIFVVEPQVLDQIPEGFADFGRDVIPALLARGLPVYASTPHGYVRDIGTPERLAAARRDYDAGLPLPS
jgi:NDP-sugar pyrophosphorylase family protein